MLCMHLHLINSKMFSVEAYGDWGVYEPLLTTIESLSPQNQKYLCFFVGIDNFIKIEHCENPIRSFGIPSNSFYK